MPKNQTTPEKLTVRCPDCGTDLTIDTATGQVLFHKKATAPLAGGHNLESLFRGLDEGKARAEDVFSRAVAAHKDRDRLMEEKFREAMKRAEEEPDAPAPYRPFDLD